MAFQYACFISYAHGQYDLIKGFIDQLKNALKAELEALLDEEVYVDAERLKPGYLYNEALAAAICKSVCMVVVYSPRYERHEYCGREFTAMEQLEQHRKALLAQAQAQVGDRGFIIPVILRGGMNLPPRIKDGRHYADFSQFSLAMTDISRHPEYAAKVREIAEMIYAQYLAFTQSGTDACATCDAFQLPPVTALPPWRIAPQPVTAVFPGRQG